MLSKSQDPARSAPSAKQ
uniref:Uncharacterized protein n=1 Tax=Arundo donax TaxID=35708 RepID=A0A0A9F5M5_ARUDO